MRIWPVAFFVALAVGCGGGHERGDVITTTGTIEFQPIEGGAWLIRADTGALYNPLNLPDAYKQVGARVQVSLIERPDLMGIPLPGVRADIVRISVLAAATTGGSQVCDPPPGADTSGANGIGCAPMPVFRSCEQTITPGGTTETCTDVCPMIDYPLACRGTMAATVPAPDQSLGCSVVPMPTPPNETFYCCPCTR